MEFESDPVKAAVNLKKHKVSFEEAASVFGDPMAYTFADPDHSIGEERWLMFGCRECLASSPSFLLTGAESIVL